MTKLKKSELYREDYGPSHCGWCLERFMLGDKAEVVLKRDDETTGRKKGDVLVIHADCFDSSIMEIA